MKKKKIKNMTFARRKIDLFYNFTFPLDAFALPFPTLFIFSHVAERPS